MVLTMVVISLVLLASLAANCASNQNMTSSEQNDQYFKTLVIDTHGGLGAEYVRHQMAKHDAWYRRKQHDRTKIFQSTKLQTSVIDKPLEPFKVHDIADNYRDQMHGIGTAIDMLKNAENYSDATQLKSADAALYLNMKLRPSQSEVIPPHKSTKTDIENMLMANGSTQFLQSVSRTNPEYFKNLTSKQIADLQSITNGSVLSTNITQISINFTKPVLQSKLLADHKPLPLLVRLVNVGTSLHSASSILCLITLVLMM